MEVFNQILMSLNFAIKQIKNETIVLGIKIQAHWISELKL